MVVPRTGGRVRMQAPVNPVIIDMANPNVVKTPHRDRADEASDFAANLVSLTASMTGEILGVGFQIQLRQLFESDVERAGRTSGTLYFPELDSFLRQQSARPTERAGRARPVEQEKPHSDIPVILNRAS